MKISVITDELTSDIETAVELAGEMELEGIEIRGVGDKRYPLVDEYWLGRVPQLVREARLPVISISPGLFRVPCPPEPSTPSVLAWEEALFFERDKRLEDELRFHTEALLPKSIEAAHALGAPAITCFTFFRGIGVAPGPAPLKLIPVLRHAADKCAEAGLKLLVENEPTCWGDTGVRTAEIVKQANHPNIGIVWDPCNAFRAGEDRAYPEGYEAVRPFLTHAHFKDAALDSKGRRPVVEQGVIDWAGQIAAFRRDGYDTFISLETHLRPKIGSARRARDRLRRLIAEAASAQQSQ